MKSIAYLTDIHLDFLKLNAAAAFCRGIAEQSPDALLLGCESWAWMSICD